MMSKLVVQPYRHMKDLFLEELLILNPNPSKAGEIAEDYLKVVLEIHNKDSRIKLLKAFLGLGEQASFTQPVSQNFVNILQDTSLAFDDIFAGDISNLKVDLEAAISLLHSRASQRKGGKALNEVVEKSIKNLISVSKVIVIGTRSQQFDFSRVNDYRLLQKIILKEKSINKEIPFDSLLDKHNHRISINDFRDYLDSVLQIDWSSLVTDFEDFYLTYLDTTQRGYIGGFELHNLYESEIKIECSLLDFMKESLNYIISFENMINTELGRVYKHFDTAQNLDKTIQASSNKIGLQFSYFQQACKFLIAGLPSSIQKEMTQSVKDTVDLLERKKQRKVVSLDEFLQIAKDLELFDNYDSLKDHIDKNLKMQQVKPPKQSNFLTQPTNIQSKFPEKKLSKNFINDEAQREKKKKIAARPSVSRVKLDSLRKSQILNEEISPHKEEVNSNQVKVEDVDKSISLTNEYIQSPDMIQKVEITNNKSSQIMRASQQSFQIQELTQQDDSEGLQRNSLESKLSDFMVDKNQPSLVIDEEDQSYLLSYRSESQVQQQAALNRQASQPHALPKGTQFITPNFKSMGKYLSKPPLNQNKNSREDLAQTIFRGISQQSNYQLNVRKSPFSSQNSIVSSKMKGGGYLPLQNNGEKLSIVKKTVFQGNLSITGSRL